MYVANSNSLSDCCKVVCRKNCHPCFSGGIILCSGFVCQPSAKSKEILQDVVISVPNSPCPQRYLVYLAFKHDYMAYLMYFVVLLVPVLISMCIIFALSAETVISFFAHSLSKSALNDLSSLPNIALCPTNQLLDGPSPNYPFPGRS